MKAIDAQAAHETRATAPVDTQWQEFDAPRDVLVLVAEVMLVLGAAPDVAREAARTGRILLGSQRLLLACSPDESALIVGALLDPGWAASPERRLHLLKANAPLLLTAGVSFAAGPSGPQLLCRWDLEPRKPVALAHWLRNFAALAADMQAVRAA
ncbi:MAG: type III secretion system chaperone [Trinickia sp.]|uniref:type III secretion system chaperone n=1 Tax=Trinickia sp. TaxID=2571163 RepID=UPI003F7E9182